VSATKTKPGEVIAVSRSGMRSGDPVRVELPAPPHRALDRV
jgi:hypothetical protein